MPEYVLTVFAVLTVTSAILLYIIKRYKALDLSLIVSIFITSLILSLGFPYFAGIFGALNSDGRPTATFQLLLVIIFIIIAYAALTFVLSIIISSFINDAASAQNVRVALSEEDTPDKKTVEEKALPSDSGKDSEKLVDSRQIIDTMGIETGENVEKPVQSYLRIPKNAIRDQLVMFDDSDLDSDEITWVKLEDDDLQEESAAVSEKTLEQLIDSAFILKANGQFIEAINEFMHALDKGPDKDLTFWLVLDICVMYKALDQLELAHDILQGYLLKYGNEMDDEIKGQIELNLFELDNIKNS